MKTWLSAFAAAALWAGAASACINDSESSSHEREFRSQYETPGNPNRSSDDDRERYREVTLGTAGAAMLVGATALTRRRRARS